MEGKTENQKVATKCVKSAARWMSTREQRLASGRLEKRSHQVYTLFEVFETSLTF